MSKQIAKDIEKVFKLVSSSNAIDEAQVYSNANAKFTELHKNITNLADYKLNPDFIGSACNVVENLYDDSYKSNKKDLVVNMLKACLAAKGINYNADELKTLDQIIESLHSNGFIVKITKTQIRINKAIKFFSKFLPMK